MQTAPTTADNKTVTTTATKAKHISKKDKVANALLSGKHLTVRDIFNDYGLNNAVDTIHKLQKHRGMIISRIDVPNSNDNGTHVCYFMTEDDINSYYRDMEGVA